MIAAAPSVASAASCPGPLICGKTCSLDPKGTPYYCSGGSCTCAPGYDTSALPDGGVACSPSQPEVVGSESDDYSCPGLCDGVTWQGVGGVYQEFDFVPVHGTAPGGEAVNPVWGYQATQCGDQGVGAVCVGGSNAGQVCTRSTDCPGGHCALAGICQGGSNANSTCHVASDCAGTCGAKTTGQCSGGTNDGLTCDDTHPCPGGTCVAMGFCSGVGGLCASDADCQGNCVGVGQCSTTLQNCSTDSDCTTGFCQPVRTWAGCTPNPEPFCTGIQDSDESSYNANSCQAGKGCGDTYCVSDFTSSYAFLDAAVLCKGTGDVSDPSRIDFPNNVAVVRAPIYWEDWSVPDDDYTMDLVSPGHELFDTDSHFPYHDTCSDATHGRIHVEYDSDDSIDHFTDSDWGDANKFWRNLRAVLDGDFCEDNLSNCPYSTHSDNAARCYLKQFVNPNLQCPLANDADPNDTCSLHDPQAVVVGVPSLDCHDDDKYGTDELHPAYAMAIRIAEDPGQPEQWAFYYRNQGDNGFCGTVSYSRCLSDFKLPLGLPVVADGKVLKSADVSVEWHAWAQDDSTPGDVTLASEFDTLNGTVLDIHLPHAQEGVVGLVTITQHYDDTPPSITCPANITVPPDLGKCSAVVSFTPQTSDDCLATATCNAASGSTFAMGTTPDTCTATDQAGQSTSCNFSVTVAAGNKCPQAQGYWKNHPSLWPVSSLTLGSVQYGKDALLAILNDSSTGDASVVLGKAEIGALLNLANNSTPLPVCGTIADANALLGSCHIPCGVSPKTTAGTAMINDGKTLDNFNMDKLTPGCTP